MFHFLFGTHSICFLFSFSSSSKPFPLCLLCNSLNSLCHCPQTLSPSRLLLNEIGIVSAKTLSPINPCELSVSSINPCVHHCFSNVASSFCDYTPCCCFPHSINLAPRCCLVSLVCGKLWNLASGIQYIAIWFNFFVLFSWRNCIFMLKC